MPALSAYERSLSAAALSAYIADEARRQWQVLKSASLPYDEGTALGDLFRRRPELYTRYQAQVLTHAGDTGSPPTVSQDVALLTRDEARMELEALAKQYLSLRLADTEDEALTKAVSVRPDLYTAFCQPEPAHPQKDPLRELQRLAREYVSKRLESTEHAAMERAIRERPEVYEAHRTQVQTVQKVIR